MISAVLMLYGPYGQHPWREDMFIRPDKIQKDLQALGFGFDIAMVTQPPNSEDTLPDVRIARNPIYDQATGVLLKADFRPGSIEEYPSIIDHWVYNFQDEVSQPDGTFQPVAHGIGLPAERLWNHKSIQTYGNRKDLMDELLNAHGVGIKTYPALEYDWFVQERGDRELIYKPQGGSLGRGVEVFENVAALRRAIETRRLPSNGLIQPYLNVMNPIQGIVAASEKDKQLLAEFNSKADRPREIRMHVIVTTDSEGRLQVETYPTLKISETNRKFSKRLLYIGLDPSCVGEGSVMYDKTVELAKAVCIAAGRPGKPVPHYYGVFDWLVDGDVRNPEDIRVVDGNCRGPHLPEAATSARDALERALVFSGKKLL